MKRNRLAKIIQLENPNDKEQLHAKVADHVHNEANRVPLTQSPTHGQQKYEIDV